MDPSVLEQLCDAEALEAVGAKVLYKPPLVVDRPKTEALKKTLALS